MMEMMDGNSAGDLGFSFGICTLPPYIPSLGNMYFIGLITLLVSNQSIDQFYRCGDVGVEREKK